MPSMSGRPRSRMIRSGWSIAAWRSPSSPRVASIDLVVLALERDAQELLQRRLVLDHQDGRARVSAIGSCARCRDVAACRTSQAVLSTTARRRAVEREGEPEHAPRRPARLDAAIVPPCASTMPRQIARPSPMPRRRLGGWARKNFSNTRFSVPGGRPGPRSATSTTSLPSRRRPRGDLDRASPGRRVLQRRCRSGSPAPARSRRRRSCTSGRSARHVDLRPPARAVGGRGGAAPSRRPPAAAATPSSARRPPDSSRVMSSRLVISRSIRSASAEIVLEHLGRDSPAAWRRRSR